MIPLHKSKKLHYFNNAKMFTQKIGFFGGSFYVSQYQPQWAYL